MSKRRHVKLPVVPGNAMSGSSRWDDLDFDPPADGYYSEVFVDRGDSSVNFYCPIDNCQYLHVPHVDGETRHRVYPRIVPGDVVESVEAERGPNGWVWVVTVVGEDLDEGEEDEQ